MARSAFNLQGDPRTPFGADDIPGDGAGRKSLASSLYPQAAALIALGGFTAINAAASAPTTGTVGGNTGPFSNVLAVLTYGATTITAVRLRLWTRFTGAGTAWVPGMSSDDGAPLTPSVDPMKTAQGEQRVFAIGAGVEFLFTLESTSPGGGANTVACAVYGVS